MDQTEQNIATLISKSKLSYEYVNMSEIDDIMKHMHSLFVSADKYVSKKMNGNEYTFSCSKLTVVSQIPFANAYSNYFFPSEIKKYIDLHACYQLHYTCIINKRKINTYFVICDEFIQKEIEKYNKYMKQMYMWIYIVNKYASSTCSKEVNIYLYFTPFRKELPSNQLIPIGPRHVNSAYTTGCKEATEIVIFRKEEWFKVFLHETFHNFGLDFSNLNMSSTDEMLRNIFNVNIEYKLYESYCESWARIMNSMFYSHLRCSIENNNTKYTLECFKMNFHESMMKESIFSLYQGSKILDFMGLNFQHITGKSADNINICNYLYKENSAVFSYYIITGLILNNYISFLKWCDTNNTNFISFHKTPSSVDKYVDYVKAITKNKEIKKNINGITETIKRGQKITGDTGDTGDTGAKTNVYNHDATLQMSMLDLWEIM